MLRNKTAIECWNILKYKSESVIDNFFPLKKQRKRSKKKHLSKEKSCSYKLCGRFIGVPERMKSVQITKRHSMQLRLKLDNLKEDMNNN